MIKVKENAKIYVICPAYIKTGGPELLHQLVYSLNNKGFNAYITYVDIKCDNDQYCNEDFNKYVSSYKIAEEIEDDKNNFVIAAETNIDSLSRIKHAKKITWWLSVDNYRVTRYVSVAYDVWGLKAAVRQLFKRNSDCRKKDYLVADYNFYQSYYAFDYLKKLGISNNSYYLSDYINDVYYNLKIESECKEDIVLYNPKKGYRFTRELIKKSPEIKWIAIQNLSTEEVRDLMIKSKVYIDFGNHPGKDRMPREAMMCGCCVVTGMRGSAQFDNDVPLPIEYKFQDDSKNLNDIIAKIKMCLKDYDNEYAQLINYRKFILNEKDKFNADIDIIFSKE